PAMREAVGHRLEQTAIDRPPILATEDPHKTAHQLSFRCDFRHRPGWYFRRDAHGPAPPVAPGGGRSNRSKPSALPRFCARNALSSASACRSSSDTGEAMAIMAAERSPPIIAAFT